MSPPDWAPPVARVIAALDTPALAQALVDLLRQVVTFASSVTITALTDDGIDEMKDMLRVARVTTETWHAILDVFVDKDLGARLKVRSPQ